MDTYIIKIFFHTIDKKFYKYIYTNISEHFPKIYHYKNNVVAVEKLQLYTEKCKQYTKLLSYYDKSSYYYKIKDNKEFYNNCNLPNEEKEIIKWATDIFNTNMRYDYDNFYDIALDNIGERKNGDIILFDP